MKRGILVIFLTLLLFNIVAAWDVDITYPINGSFYDDTVIQLDVNLTSGAYSNCWWDDGLINRTFLCGDDTISSNVSSLEDWNIWTVYANDTNGTIKDDSVTFWVDSIEPNLTILDPSGNLGYTNGNTLSLFVDLFEVNKGGYFGNGIIDSSVNYIWRQFEYPASGWLTRGSYTLSSTNISDVHHDLIIADQKEGNYTFIVKSRDKYPNGTTINEVGTQGVIIRDVTNPFISINNPFDGENLTDSISVQVNSSDPYPAGVSDISGIDYIILNITNGTYQNVSNSTSGIYNFEWDSSTVSDGLYQVIATNYDKAGNINTTNITINVDNTEPLIFFNNPIAGNYSLNQTVNITAFDANLKNVSIYVDGVEINTSLSEVLYDLSYGNHTIYGIAYDIFGNYNVTEIRNILVDNIAPYYTSIENKINDVYSPLGVYQFNSTWWDGLIGLDSVWVDFNGSNYTTYEITSGKYSFNITDLAAGNYTFQWWANDSLGNINSSVIYNYEISKATTICSISSNSPFTYSISPNVNVSAFCNSNESSFALFRNGTDITGEENTNISLGAGTYNYIINISETQNYTANSSSILVVVNKGISSVELLFNGSDTYIGGEAPELVNVTGIIQSGQGNIQLYINGSLANSGSSPLENITNLALGTYNVSVVYLENENWTADVEEVEISIIDSIAPLIGAVGPADNIAFEYYDNNISFTYNVADYLGVSAISTCELWVDESLNASFAGDVNFTSLFDSGIYNWYIKCNDSQGNFNSTEIRSFTILENMTQISDFDNYTNLTLENNISNVLYFFVNNTYGMINFTESIDFSSGFDWSSFINITNESIYVNSSIDELNKTAVLTFYNINYTRPEIMKDGERYCSSNSCYNYTNNTLVIEVDGFTEYIVREYVAPPIVYSGGGSSRTTRCYEGGDCWECTEWTECFDSLQSRTCTEKDFDYVYEDKPVESRECIMPEEDSEEIINNTEVTEEITSSPTSLFTGAFLGIGSGVWTGIEIFALILILGVIGYWFFNKD